MNINISLNFLINFYPFILFSLLFDILFLDYLFSFNFRYTPSSPLYRFPSIYPPPLKEL